MNDAIRPALAADGTEIEVVGIDSDSIVQIRLTGACQGCTTMIPALTFEVERTLKAQIPEIRFVEAVL